MVCVSMRSAELIKCHQNGSVKLVSKYDGCVCIFMNKAVPGCLGYNRWARLVRRHQYHYCDKKSTLSQEKKEAN